jgi:hypothetical protein
MNFSSTGANLAFVCCPTTSPVCVPTVLSVLTEYTVSTSRRQEDSQRPTFGASEAANAAFFRRARMALESVTDDQAYFAYQAWSKSRKSRHAARLNLEIVFLAESQRLVARGGS